MSNKLRKFQEKFVANIANKLGSLNCTKNQFGEKDLPVRPSLTGLAAMLYSTT